MKLPATHHLTEADLAASFYYQAWQAKLLVYLEVKMPSAVHRSKSMRVDAVVVNPKDDEILCCVEIKRPRKRFGKGTRQHQAYESLERDYGIPTLWLNSFVDIPKTVEKIVGLKRREECGVNLPRSQPNLVAGADRPSAL